MAILEITKSIRGMRNTTRFFCGRARRVAVLGRSFPFSLIPLDTRLQDAPHVTHCHSGYGLTEF
jgi:hypothetical protein